MNFAKEIAGLPGLMKTSAEQLRKVPALTGTAMLTALNVRALPVSLQIR